jgi:hypothetical protein
MYLGAFLVAYIFGQIATITAENNEKFDLSDQNAIIVNKIMISKKVDEEI